MMREDPDTIASEIISILEEHEKWIVWVGSGLSPKDEYYNWTNAIIQLCKNVA